MHLVLPGGARRLAEPDLDAALDATPASAHVRSLLTGELELSHAGLDALDATVVSVSAGYAGASYGPVTAQTPVVPKSPAALDSALTTAPCLLTAMMLPDVRPVGTLS